ncbi:GxxExxY protein [Mesoterricola sediminis]|uniref:GxxExxY protein n=1 Tax=Mesoterricola sediminis TaxID=2927980 RepID=UPI003744B169
MGRHWGEVDGEDHPHKEITQAIIGEAIEIQKALGHGLLEDPYKVCLAHSLRLAGHKVKREVFLDIEWRGLVGLILSPRASARSSAPPRSNRMLRMRGAIRHCSTDSLFQLLHAPARMGISHYYPGLRTHPSPRRRPRPRRSCGSSAWPASG